MVMQDMMVVAFSTKGLSGVLSAHAQIAQAQMRVANAQTAAANAPIGSSAYFNALRQVQAASISNFEAAKSAAVQAATSTLALAGALGLTIDRYVKFGAEVAKVRALTGANSKDSTAAVLLGRAAGMNDLTEIRELLRSGSAVFNAKGQGALSKLGIAASPNQSGLSLLNQVIDRLQVMPDSLRKTQIMEDIFGARGVAAMLPLLRLTKDQRSEIENLGGSFGGQALDAIQQFQFRTALLGATFEQQLIFPIAAQLLPVLSTVISYTTGIIHVWSQLDRLLGGVPTWIVAMLTFGLAIGSVARTIGLVVNAYRALITTQIISQALAGPGGWAKLAIGAGVAAGAIVSVNAMLNKSPGSEGNSSTDRFASAVDKFESNVNRMGDAFDSLKGNGVPGDLSGMDVISIFRAGAIGAVG